jgi:hypothetical protein
MVWDTTLRTVTHYTLRTWAQRFIRRSASAGQLRPFKERFLATLFEAGRIG